MSIEPEGIPYLWRGRVFALLGLSFSLLFVVVFASFLGSARIPFLTCFKILASELPFIDLNPSCPESFKVIVLDVRLPRIVLAGVVGAALSVAGATYQGLFRNPLADPYLLGVASGAGLGATIGFLSPLSFQWKAMGTIPLFAFIGALGAVTVVYFLARVGKTLPPTTLILAGVAMGALLSSITSYLMTIAGEGLHAIVFWLLGGFSLARWDEVLIVLPYVIVGILVIFLYARALNVMQLDEEQAQQLGIDVEKVKRILLLSATLITASAICFAGLIGFVGIIIPHTARLIWGPDHRFLLPLSTLIGAIFLILADTLAHTLIPPHEIPVGVVTAFFGAPFFLYLLRQRKKEVFFHG